MTGIKEFVNRTKWIIAGSFLCGVVFILIGEILSLKYGIKTLAQVIVHVGIAFIIAGIIGCFLELTEIKEFFEKRLAGILAGDDFMQMVSEDTLYQLNYKTMIGLATKCLFRGKCPCVPGESVHLFRG